MTRTKAAPKTLAAALSAGFKRFEELPAKLQTQIRAYERDGPAGAAADGGCTAGQTGPCSTVNYPDGSRKVCYCNAAGQCDDCVFEGGS